MPQVIPQPVSIEAPGMPPKTILEYFGRVSSGDDSLSLARMISPPGWSEPGQCPEFDEFTLVLRGVLQVESEQEVITVSAGEAVVTRRGEWIRYSTPGPDGAEYLAVCLPAFSLETVHRDEQDG